MAADTTYTIRLIDQATGAGRRVERALTGVDAAAKKTAGAMRGQDRAYRAAAKEAERLARIELKLARSLSTTARAAARNSRAMGNLRVRTKGASQSVGGLGRGISLTSALLAGALVVGAGAAGVSMVKASANADLLRDTFNRVAGNKTEFPAIQKQIRSLGLDLVEGEKAALNLRTAFGKVTTTKFLSLFKAAQLSGENTKRVAVQLNQIQGRGLLQGENLNTIVEAIPGLNRGAVTKAIAKELKITQQAAAKKLQSGKLEAGIGIRAIFEGTVDALKLGNLDEFNKKLETSTLSRLANAANNMTDAKRSLGKALEKTAFVSILGKISSTAASATNSIGVSGLAGAFDVLGFSLGAVGVVLAGIGIKAALTSFAVGAAAATAPLAVMGGAVFALAGSMALLVKSMQQFSAVGGFSALSEAIGAELSGERLGGKATIGGVIQTGDPLGEMRRRSINVLGQGRAISDAAGVFSKTDPGLQFQTAKDLVDGTAAAAATAGSSGQSNAQLAHVGAAAGAAAVAGRGKGGVTIGKAEIQVNVDGSKDPEATAQAVASELEFGFITILENHAEGVGG